jgi:hypothetical protein
MISILKEGLRAKGIDCAGVVDARWGSITKIRLPSGGEIGLYEPSTHCPKIKGRGVARLPSQSLLYCRLTGSYPLGRIVAISLIESPADLQQRFAR